MINLKKAIITKNQTKTDVHKFKIKTKGQIQIKNHKPIQTKELHPIPIKIKIGLITQTDPITQTDQKLEMKKKTLIHSFIVLIVAFVFISCDKSQVFDEYHTFEDGWKKNSIINFTFNREASTTPYNMFINIRDNDDYEFSNLFLIVKLEQPDGLTTIDTLEYQMAYPDGNLQGTLLGTGFSDIKESKLWYKEKAVFSKKGKYKLSIQQAVRQTGKIKGVEKLNGITEIGFRIESLEKK